MFMPRLATLVAALGLAPAAALAAPVQNAAPPPAAAASMPAFSDADLLAYDGAVTRLRALTAGLNGAPPTAAQQAELAGVVQQSGLAVERYNAIAKASAGDPAVRARIALLKTPMPESDSVAAGVTDDELERYVSAVDRIREITSRIEDNRADPQQSAALGEAVRQSGLNTERYNAIATAVFEDPWLKARARLLRAQREASPSPSGG